MDQEKAEVINGGELSNGEKVPYEKLDITNSFIFYKVMRSNKDLCKELLEIILNKKIKEFEFTEAEYTEKTTIDSKGIRLDVYAENGDKTEVYDIEMQALNVDDIFKRTRYYQSVIDNALLAQGIRYQKLRDTYVIFLCKFDLLGAGRAYYTIKNCCIEDKNIPFPDGATRIIINSTGDDEKLTPEMRNLIRYIANRSVGSDFTKKLDEAVTKACHNKEWERDYMLADQQILQWKYEGEKKGRAEGREEGREEGRNLERIEMLSNLLANGLSEDIVLQSGYTEEDILKAREKMTNIAE